MRGIRIYCNLSNTYIDYIFLLPGTCFVLLSLLCIFCVLKLEEDYVHVVLFCLLCGFGLL